MAPCLEGIRVVVAEDHHDTLDLIEQVLKHLGATVIGVTHARDALAVVGEADIIITDFAMGEENGVWLLEQVNQHPRPVPVILVSGFTPEQVSRLQEAPFAAKLLKPVDPWELAEVIVRIL